MQGFARSKKALAGRDQRPLKAPKAGGLRSILASGLLAMGLALGGCVSLGVEVPDTLLTLTPSQTAPAGAGGALPQAGEAGGGGGAKTIAILTPEVPATLDVLRVPVQVSDTNIAYLADAFWVEKPARLFRRLLGERLRAAKAADLVLDSDNAPLRAQQFLRGTLIDLGYDAPSRSVIVRYDAIRTDAEGAVITRRFEARESDISADVTAIAPALNRAANEVAGDVAGWIAQTP